MSRRHASADPHATTADPPSVEVDGSAILDAEPEAGQVLSARYVLEAQIGQGAMGWVWRARDVELSRTVAVKILLPSLAEQTEIRERFAREARAIAALDHPNVVPVYDVGREGSYCYFVMKHLSGKPLHLIIENGPMPVEEAVNIAQQILDGLQHLHAQGLVHRDIKPGNVIVGPGGQATIVDFGILRAQTHEPRMTAAGVFFGTPEYVAPEIVLTEPGEPRSDLYSLGVTLFELLTGDVPFSGDTPIEIVTRHLRDPVPMPSSVRGGVPPELDAVVLRALSKHPSGRYGSAMEMRAALEAVRPALQHPVANESRRTPTAHIPALPLNRVGRRTVLLGLAAAVALGAMAVLVGSLTSTRAGAITATPLPPPREPEASALSSAPAVAHPPAAAGADEPPVGVPPPTSADRAPPSSPAGPTVRSVPQPPVREPTAAARRTTKRGPQAPAPSAQTAPAKEPPAAASGSTLDRARAALRAGSASQAVALFQQASRESPGSATPFRGLGDAYVAIGNRTAAVAAYRRYLLSSPQARDRADIEARLARLGASGH